MDVVLKVLDMVAEIERGLNDPLQQRTGKTYSMCQDIAAVLLDLSDAEVLVYGVSIRHCRLLLDTLVGILKSEDIKYHRTSGETVCSIDHRWSVIFNILKGGHKKTKTHPTSVIFIDHFTEEVFVLDSLQKLKDDLAISKYGDRTTNKEETENRMQYVLFDPVVVGWGICLEKSIENAKTMHLPLGVKSKEIAIRVQRMYPDVTIIVKGE